MFKLLIRSPGVAQPFATIAQSKPTKKPAETTEQKTVESQPPQVVDDVKFNDISVATFPPLTASTGASSKVDEIKSNPSRPVADLKPIVKENETIKEAVLDDDKTIANNIKTSVKPTRKPKFEFKNNSSVIFLDELTPNGAGTTAPSASIDSQSQQANGLSTGNTDPKAALKSNGLNGIKFGFMDSSSSCEEDEEPAVKTDAIVEVNTHQEDLSVKTNPRKPSNYLQAKKHLIKTTSNSSFKSGSSTKVSSSHRTTTSTTSTSSENEDAETRPNHRKPKHKSAKKPANTAVNQKAKTSSSSFKSNNRKSSEDSSSNVDRLTVEAKLANSNNVHSFPAPNVYPAGGTTLPTPPPQYIYYQNQLNQGYFATCYAAINPSNGAYMMPPPPAALNFVAGNPYFPNQTMLPAVKPAAYYQLPAAVTQENIADGKPLNEHQAVVSESSSLPLKEVHSSQSADSSNSTTPTPTTNPQDGSKETLNPQQPPVAPALTQLNPPEYYPTPFGNLYKKITSPIKKRSKFNGRFDMENF